MLSSLFKRPTMTQYLRNCCITSTNNMLTRIMNPYNEDLNLISIPTISIEPVDISSDRIKKRPLIFSSLLFLSISVCAYYIMNKRTK